mgnify:CR=1 FL=1
MRYDACKSTAGMAYSQILGPSFLKMNVQFDLTFQLAGGASIMLCDKGGCDRK